ncbi:hypothetical protein GIB67_036465 [Kingdonia uniflora]|uniref:Myb/SANT-like domain-containing protein n=1 Tax=Kingdonia uniflora TaxID=39325 RepID=A0A7J7MH99_9MAGN|nr:hypothetical protein GIB67_036465 [Kingdonia uniflora]
MNGNEDHWNNAVVLATVTTAVSLATAATYLMFDNPREPYSNKGTDMSKEVCTSKGAHKKNGVSKKAILKWNATIDASLIKALVEGGRLGLKENNIWDDMVWTIVQKDVQEKVFIQVERSHIDKRYRSLRKEYIAFDLVKSKSGFGWDPSKKTKNFEEFSRFRYEGPKWSFESLQVIFGQNHATRKYSFNGLDSIDADNDICGDDALEADSANMKNSIDPVKRASNIREEVMKVEGYSEHFLRDPVELQLFIAGDAKYKKMVLDGYRNRIYE